jgi:RNA polymerase sigma-70 factor (ECF subfamily)
VSAVAFHDSAVSSPDVVDPTGRLERSEAEAEAALVEHRGFVRSLARSLVGGTESDDLAQDALVAGLERPPSSARAWRSWLRATVAHLASNVVRSRRRIAARERAAAAREAQPSTAALVERLELEQRVVAAVLTLPEPERSVVLLRFYDGQSTAAIAQRLRAPADTVRARLRRALTRLRDELDRRCGGRDAWIAGLAPLIGGMGAPALPTAATSGAAKALATTGAIVMSGKLVALLFASAVVATTWFAVSHESTRARRDGDGAASSGPIASLASKAAASTSSSSPAAVDAATPDPQRVALAPSTATSHDATANSNAALPPPGEVAFRVVDAATRALLDDVTIRLLNESRFCEYHGHGEGRAKLTSGRWTARVTARGCEPVTLGAFEVERGRVVDLGTVELARGGGRIDGRVVARDLPPNGKVVVELRGEGRSPCPECRARVAKFEEWQRSVEEAAASGREPPKTAPRPGDCCGYHEVFSSFTLAGGGDFSFRGLAAGTYWIRAVDSDARLAESRRVEIGRDGSAWLELDVTEPTTLALELRDESNHAFAGDWSTPHRETAAPIEFELAAGEKAIGVAHAQPKADDVRATRGPPIAVDAGRSSDGEEVGDRSARQASGEFLPLLAYREQVSASFATAIADAESARRDGARILDLAAASELVAIETTAGLAKSDRLDRARQEGDALVAADAPPELPRVELRLAQERPELFVVGPLPRAKLVVSVTCGHFASGPVDVDLRFGFSGPLVVTMHAADGGIVHGPLLSGAAKSCASCHDGAASGRALSDLPLVRRREAMVDLLERGREIDRGR